MLKFPSLSLTQCLNVYIYYADFKLMYKYYIIIFIFVLNYVCLFYMYLRPDQFDFREHGFFSKFEGPVSRKKRKIKKNPQFFCVGFEYQ